MAVVIDDAAIEETLEMVLDTRAALTEAMSELMPFDEVEGLIRELAIEIVDVYWAVHGEDSL